MPAKWGRVPIWWFQRLRDLEASRMARDVVVVLAAHASKMTGEAYPSIETIAATLGVGEHAVKLAVAELKGAGLVKVRARNRRKGESNLYYLAVNGTPFQVTDSVTQSPDNQVTEMVTQNERLGYQNGSDQVTKSVQNQVHDLCSNRANNLPVEPTSEPSVLTTFERGRQRNNGSTLSTAQAYGRAVAERYRKAQGL